MAKAKKIEKKGKAKKVEEEKAKVNKAEVKKQDQIIAAWDDFIRDVDATWKDVEKCVLKGNNVAGTRARKSLQGIKKKSQTIRLAIQDLRTLRKNS